MLEIWGTLGILGILEIVCIFKIFEKFGIRMRQALVGYTHPEK